VCECCTPRRGGRSKLADVAARGTLGADALDIDRVELCLSDWHTAVTAHVAECHRVFNASWCSTSLTSTHVAVLALPMANLIRLGQATLRELRQRQDQYARDASLAKKNPAALADRPGCPTVLASIVERCKTKPFGTALINDICRGYINGVRVRYMKERILEVQLYLEEAWFLQVCAAVWAVLCASRCPACGVLSALDAVCCAWRRFGWS
jgi:hypothetical protein